MASSLQTLLAGTIDYAGLFPPANLPLERAIHQYVCHLREPDHWMLGRFICPAERLGELTPFVPKLFSPRSPLQISTLGRGGESPQEFLTGLRADADAIAAFRDRHGEHVEVAVYEVRLPSAVPAAGTKEVAQKLLDAAARTIEETRLPSLTLYYEAAPGTAWRSSMIMLSTALADDNRLGVSQGRRRWRPAGFKLRCGGLKAADFPSPQRVAFTITACRDAAVALKFTAGLHHPLRHFDAGVQTEMHGFLNVFGAGVLAHARQLNEDQVEPIIEDENPENFAFHDDGFRWKDIGASVAEIELARRSAVISFGSCSFEEPCDDLRAMGLL